ncbi:DNA ligase D [Pusillimonas sp.]|uniref:DNA ligase D n=1 Tax=Pusillimonas sp. TaxID=3040095 RepID=UPI0029B65A2E|nr:DNA ligase D [Pusillimonas sp.]MDX3893169.1 DNA ligase D [Pusillimonas sp.]
MKTRLETYRQKRDFRVTHEPQGRRSSKSSRHALRYVIQRHQARRLHYDFRLEIDGVLVSWAVPKGPSLDPSVKRLAVHVEDHPLEYGDFEGDIPAGQYGAGHVDIWDSGSWTPSSEPARALADGHLKFELDGGLKGEWVLLRTGKEDTQWLLRKLDDEYARPGHDAEQDGEPRDGVAAGIPEDHAKSIVPAKAKARRARAPKSQREPPPATLSAQLATLVDRPPTGPGWSYEVKYDGYRILCRLEGKTVKLVSRNGNEWNARMKGLARSLGQLALGDGWIDGEVVCFDKQGISRFQALQQALDGASNDLVFVAFDLPFWNGIDLRPLPLSERQQRLEELLEQVPADSPIMFTQKLDISSDTEGASAWTEACRLSLEGLICKKKDAAYTEGRSTTWLKLKCRPQQEFVVGGYTEPSGARSHLGALLVGLRDGKKLNYAGRVGTGFTQATLKDLHERLQKLHRKTSPFATPTEGRGRYGRSSGAVRWVSPKLVAEVDYAGWTEDGLLRQAAFRGLREDKPPSAVTGEQATTPEALEADTADEADGRRKRRTRGDMGRPAGKKTRKGPVVVGGVTVTHPERIVYTKPDFSKRALIEYYDSVAELMLPHLLKRRVALLRCPQGTNATCFFQKHLRSEAPAGIMLDGEQVVVENARGLLELAQFGVIEFHTWGSSLPRPERPDRITLDLDPDPDIPWADIVIAARLVQRLMEEAGLVPYLKTTGGKGLHLVAPIKVAHSWDTVKGFSRAMAAYLAREAPAQFTASVSKARRKGLIFVDYLRNGNGATAIAAFSARARQGAPVSMPLAWDELDSRHDLRAAQFNITNALHHRREQGGDPWHDYASNRKALRLGFQKELQA